MNDDRIVQITLQPNRVLRATVVDREHRASREMFFYSTQYASDKHLAMGLFNWLAEELGLRDV